MAPMVHRYYSAEFRADAVTLYCSDPSLTYAQVARDLGVHADTHSSLFRRPRAPGRPWGRASRSGRGFSSSILT
ncbi:transposase [Kitasatospora sp. NPDC059327]|uniref:transposase n=1 Tax=Kitasatospora sp. NPDC059327 TaxID=3346803 RepID=UPI0036930090